MGFACLNPQWGGGRPRLLNRDDEDFVVQTATTRPTVLGSPSTRWSIRKLADHLRRNISRATLHGHSTGRWATNRSRRSAPWLPAAPRRTPTTVPESTCQGRSPGTGGGPASYAGVSHPGSVRGSRGCDNDAPDRPRGR
ncbi:helix-turn-helix domain-containing protein [Streptomyces sp. NPDC002287]